MRYSIYFIFVAVAALFAATSLTDGARILSIFPMPGPSQYIFASALLKELARREHEVTSISAFPQQKPLKNFRDIEIPENLGLFDDVVEIVEPSERSNNISISDYITGIFDIGEVVSNNIFQNAAVQTLLKSKTEKFDLVIVEALVTDSLYGFAQHFNAPIIGVSTFSTLSFIDLLVGNRSPVSYCPHAYLPFPSKMTFLERLANLIVDIMQRIIFDLYHMPRQRALYAKYFPTAKTTLDDLMRNFSLVFLNQHFSLNTPRPYVPNMIEVGGLHVKQQPDPLPTDMQQFLDNATEGAIYFSLGSNFPSSKLTPAKRQILLNTFASLKQKVFWKFEDDSIMADKPDNVYISKWFPQPSVLAHPNVKVFISHGGWLSTTESIYHAKPILGVPLFADQPLNVATAVARGYALSIDIHTLNEAELKEKLYELLQNPSYTETVAKLSKIYRDQPMPPLETAVYWMEYVLRHDGAAHMRNAGQDLNFLQYHSLDTILMIFGTILLVLLLLIWALVKLIKVIFGFGSSKKPMTKLKRN